MPSDEYTSIARGPLKLKGGASVTKKKKKKDKSSRSDLEKNLSTGSETPADAAPPRSPDLDTANATAHTKSEKQSSGPATQHTKEEKGQPDDEVPDQEAKTETERRFAEAKRKRLKELTESGRIRPELLKTHKQRVEELNAHLARLSEHHDMPKIGPG